MANKYEDLIKICEPDTLEVDGGKPRARFYLADLAKKIESEKMLMKDKAFEEVELMLAKWRRELF